MVRYDVHGSVEMNSIVSRPWRFASSASRGSVSHCVSGHRSRIRSASRMTMSIFCSRRCRAARSIHVRNEPYSVGATSALRASCRATCVKKRAGEHDVKGDTDTAATLPSPARTHSDTVSATMRAALETPCGACTRIAPGPGSRCCQSAHSTMHARRQRVRGAGPPDAPIRQAPPCVAAKEVWRRMEEMTSTVLCVAVGCVAGATRRRGLAHWLLAMASIMKDSKLATTSSGQYLRER